MVEPVGTPLSWTARALGRGSRFVGEGVGEIRSVDTAPIEIRDLRIPDLKRALRKGVDDFAALRTDVMFIVVIYPLAGLLLAWFALNREMMHLLFPMVAGFALLGPVAAVGLYEMSRRRELGLHASWADAFGVMRSPSFIPIVVLGAYLAAIFVAWLFAANTLYNLTLGPEPPSSIPAFIGDVFTTGAGLTMLIAGVAVGFVFAALALVISLVSFPLLLDRHVGVPNAIVTSMKIARRNPVVVAAWGAIVVVSLCLSVMTLFIGLIVALPILGHATWHLYRRAVVGRVSPKAA